MTESGAAALATSRSRSFLESNWIGAALVTVLFCAPLFIHLGRGDLQGDEPIYAFAVDVILETGDWMTPRSIPHEDAAFFEKPPLKFWIVAAAIRSGLLPHSDFSQRFFDALFGGAAFLYVFAIGARLGGPVCGVLAVLTLFVHRPLLFEHGLRSHNMEAALVLSYCGGIYHLLAWRSSAGRMARRLHPFAIAAFFALGFMTKFVAAIFLPLIIVLMLCVFGDWFRRWLEDWRAWTAATALAVLIIAPWFAYHSIQHGRAFWDVILGVHVYQRLTTFVDRSHLRPWHYYLSTVYDELAWNHTLVPAACGAVALVIVTVRRRWDTGMLVMLWFAVPFALISVGSSKLYHYSYPFLPPVGLAAGFLPGLLLQAGSPLRQKIEAWGRRLPGLLSGNRIDPMKAPALTRLATAVAVVAFAVAAITVTYGRFGIRVGDILIFRNASIARPLLIGLALLIAASRGRLAARLTLVLLVLLAVPVDGYKTAIESLDNRDAPVRRLTACLEQQLSADEHAAVYAHAEDLGQWKYFYYFRQFGWQRPYERPVAALPPRLFDAGQLQPVMLSAEDYRRLNDLLRSGTSPDRAAPPERMLEAVARVQLDDSLMLLLPGRFAGCAKASARHPRSTGQGR